MAAAGAKPVPLEEPGGERGYGAHDVPDESADVESATVVSGVLAAALHVIGHLGEVERWVLVLRYFEGLKLHDIGPLLGLDKDEVRKRWETAVLDIHSAMLRAAAVPGGCACNGQCECS
jgi:DNA-directed RNA polymerase specialized sigma24 family protein